MSNVFVILEFKFIALILLKSDLVHDVETIHMLFASSIWNSFLKHDRCPGNCNLQFRWHYSY